MINIAKKARAMGITHCSLGFSTGKDSLVGLDLLLKENINVIPIYFYICPDLEFIEDNITKYEKLFSIKIERLPHPCLYMHLDSATWQDYQSAANFSQIKYNHRNFYEFAQKMLESKNLDILYKYDAVCMKMSDSLNRRLLLRKLPDICTNTKKIYLTKYFTDKDIFEYLKQNNIPLTRDYEIFGMSWDGLSYHFLTGVKQYYPNDFNTIKKMFPLIEAELIKYELYKKHKS